jgi:hypothetical protein
MIKLEVGQMAWVWMHQEQKPKHGIVIQSIEKCNEGRNVDWGFGHNDYVLLMDGEICTMEDYRCFHSYEALEEYESMAHGVSLR